MLESPHARAREGIVPEIVETPADHFIRGGDISTLSALEAAGRSFSDAAGIRPAEQILADHGWNWVRLRLWVDSPNQFNGLADVAAMARRAKQAHLRFLLCLHYSDFWADPAKQHIPAAWVGQDLPALAATVQDYTRTMLAALSAQGAAPDIVQIGNEVTAGMLWPHGQIDRDGQEHWAEFATLLKAGIAGAREAAPPGRGPALMVHIDRGGDAPGAQRFFDQILAQGVDFDWIGLSYYPFWHGTLDDLRRTLSTLATRYGKPLAVVETAYPWTLEDQDGYPNVVGPATELPPDYPPTPAGQTRFLRDLLALIAQTPEGLGCGLVYWEPAWIPGVGWKPGAGNNWDNLTVFDAQGRALESINCMQPADPANGLDPAPHGVGQG
jgi:arabinogalactan endo-1,4-beta-galactosidase